MSTKLGRMVLLGGSANDRENRRGILNVSADAPDDFTEHDVLGLTQLLDDPVSLRLRSAHERAKDSHLVSPVSLCRQIESPLRTLVEEPTIAGWARSAVAAGDAAQTDVAAIAEALIELGQLSEEEVRAQLDAETSTP